MVYMSTPLTVNGERLVRRLEELGQIGRDGNGTLTRLAASDADRQGRDALVSWMKSIGLDIQIDRVGNLFGIWQQGDVSLPPVMVGSHIDTVINAGVYDGCYGVLSGLEVIETLRESGYAPARPIAVAAFTGEEGVRFAPDMIGSLAYVGGSSLEKTLATVSTDGKTLGEELKRIGYSGDMAPDALRPHCYVELHIEQGPVLEHEGFQIGAVETIQAISWQRVVIEGQANHAGTTPMKLRRDAGLAAARVVTYLRDYVGRSNSPTVATVGTMQFEPNAINVIPSRATLTVDLRDPDEIRLQTAENALCDFLSKLEKEEGTPIRLERLARFEPVNFDDRIVALIEQAAREMSLKSRRIASGAGHDAQMIARIAPAAMIFVPSINGISHSPDELTPPDDLVTGANVLLRVVSNLVKAEFN
jgi:beta-ureidopropionase / N-carbamoyl-L-amino-acid hydrolase